MGPEAESETPNHRGDSCAARGGAGGGEAGGMVASNQIRAPGTVLTAAGPGGRGGGPSCSHGVPARSEHLLLRGSGVTGVGGAALSPAGPGGGGGAHAPPSTARTASSLGKVGCTCRLLATVSSADSVCS